ncbi:GIY-YIG nuclease family protein [Comamonas terrigena]|uniref:GIY-YIG nuclease family protein n=1 Tax=Comamonas terrigena TaxID=32013 RepID=UPI002899BA29|nr:GIY-YIG nuclease family protein [Comamonas terrigena]
MKSGHLYVLSNVFLGPDVLKLGLTTRDPASRAAELSKSTAIPGPFHLEFASPVKDCKLAERRLHLLLKEARLSKDKEFFRVSVLKARSLCAAIAKFESEETPASSHLLMHPDFIFTRILPRQSLHVLKALMHILSATQHNSFIGYHLDERLLIVDGFTCGAALAKFRGIRSSAANAALRKIAEVASALTYPLPGFEKPIPLFSNFIYEKGHVSWTFNPVFRRLFIIPEEFGDHHYGFGNEVRASRNSL